MHEKHNESQNETIVYCAIGVAMSFILGWRDIYVLVRFELKGHVMRESDVKSHVEGKKHFVYSCHTHFISIIPAYSADILPEFSWQLTNSNIASTAPLSFAITRTLDDCNNHLATMTIHRST